MMSRCVISVVCLFICILIAIVLISKIKGIDISPHDYKHIIEQREGVYSELMERKKTEVDEIQRLIELKEAYIEYANTELLDKEQEIIDLKSGTGVKTKKIDNGGGPSSLNESEKGYINKKYDNKDKYEIEKRCYMRLKGEPHFANLIKFDDNTLTLTMSHVGKPVTKFTYVPNFKSQINNINTILDKHNIQHGDIHLNNILIHENVLYVIDFEWAVDKSVVKEWQERRGHSQFYRNNKLTQDIWLHKKELPDPEPYSTFTDYIGSTYQSKEDR